MPTVPKQKSIKKKKEKDGHCPTKNKQKEKQLQNKQNYKTKENNFFRILYSTCIQAL